MPESGAVSRVRVAMTIWECGYIPEDFAQLRLDLQHVLDCIAPEPCCVCDSPRVEYHNYKGQPFCVPCANGGGAT